MKLYLIPIPILLILVSVNAYAQVADTTVGGIIVPKFTSTQNNYCSNGQCSTGSIPVIPINYSKSINKYNILLITPSNTCNILNKNHQKGCIPLQDIIKYDTSNQMYSGHFINKSGVEIRESPQMKKNWLAYAYSTKTVICVACYFDISATQKSQQIILMPNTFTYVNKTESESKHIISDFSNRYMQSCDIATIANIPGLLQDTIHYMLSGCLSTATSFNATKIHTLTVHNQNYFSPYSSTNQDLYLKLILKGHTYDFGNKTSGGRGPSDCIRHSCVFVDPFKKIGY